MSILAFLFMDKMLLLYALLLPPMWVAFAFIIIAYKNLKKGFDWIKLLPFIVALLSLTAAPMGIVLIIAAVIVVGLELIYEPAISISLFCFTFLAMDSVPASLVWWITDDAPHFGQYPFVILLLCYIWFLPKPDQKEEESMPFWLTIINGVAPGFVHPFTTPSNKSQTHSELATFILAIFLRPTGKSVVSELLNMIDPVEGSDPTILLGIILGVIVISFLYNMKVQISEVPYNTSSIVSYISMAAILATFIINSTLGGYTIPVLIICVIWGYLLAVTKSKCFLSMVVLLSSMGVGA